MPWWATTWAQWAGWTVGYALAFWAISVAQAVLEPRLAAWLRRLVPLILAFLIGVRFRSWWWILGPPVAITLMTLTYAALDLLTSPAAVRAEKGTGFVLAVFLVLVEAGLALLAGAAGVAWGRR